LATKEEKIEMEGEVVEAFPNGMFKVQLDEGHEVLGYTAGRCAASASRSSPAIV
jgi:translation initiation factor IF-1